MLNDEICRVREKLNKSIENDEDYKVIYQISVELDKLIEEYYGITKKAGKIIGEKLIIEQQCKQALLFFCTKIKKNVKKYCKKRKNM